MNNHPLHMNDDASRSTSSSSSSSSWSLLPRILSGSIGSMAVALAVTPLEVVKVRQQAYSPLPCTECGSTIHNGLLECAFPMDSTLRPRGSTMIMPIGSGGTISTMVSIFKNEGYRGLYAGLGPTLLMSLPNTVVYFAAYDELSSRLRHYHDDDNDCDHADNHDADSRATAANAYIPLLAGSTARLLATLATAPLELVRTRQAGLPRGTTGVGGMVDEFLALNKSSGSISLYSGLAPTLWRDVPFSAIYWVFLERFKDALSSPSESTRFLGKWGGYHHVVERGIDRIPPAVEAAQAFVAGAAAGSIAAAFTTPFDVVKTRRQMIMGQISATRAATARQQLLLSDRRLCTFVTSGAVGDSGTFGQMRQIIQREGITGLWRGNLTRMMKVAPACAIMISCYEFGKRVFGEVTL
ncbi:hypothetical protein ACHAXA_001158 [Cyclostephanos tholiformis]|uniref:Mitochondrial carrier protein n=1 Tax=Cyclostephanos tholiformis TaxID=382380 RepID=A0ABD3R380_9STRA